MKHRTWHGVLSIFSIIESTWFASSCSQRSFGLLLWHKQLLAGTVMLADFWRPEQCCGHMSPVTWPTSREFLPKYKSSRCLFTERQSHVTTIHFIVLVLPHAPVVLSIIHCADMKLWFTGSLHLFGNYLGASNTPSAPTSRIWVPKIYYI